MIIKIRNITSLGFKLMCFVLTTSMVGFWAYKYQKNEDVSVIEYKSVASMEDMVYPELTICIDKPFVAKTLMEFNVTYKEYHEYMKGNERYKNNETLESIPFVNATIDVFDYLQYPILIEKRDGTFAKEAYTCSSSLNCRFVELRNSYNGFWGGVFHKCYSIGVKQKFSKTVKHLEISFDQSLMDVLEQMRWIPYAFVIINYPHQLLRYDSIFQPVLQTDPDGVISGLFTFSNIEVLQRRKKGASCVSDWQHYDELVLSKHLETVGCANPYQNGNNITCETPKEKENAKYRFDMSKDRYKYHTDPCQELTNAEYGLEKNFFSVYKNDTRLYFGITYPDKMKIISQARSVDFHALIGNIGGYIGLFLGIFLQF